MKYDIKLTERTEDNVELPVGKLILYSSIDTIEGIGRLHSAINHLC